MGSGSSIKKGAFISYGVIVFNIVAGLLYTPWMISKIGRADYGLYILVTTFLTYFTVDYGMWQSVNKIVAQLHAKGELKKENDVISVATTIYAFLDLVIALVLLGIYWHVERFFPALSPPEMSTFKVLFLWAALFSLLSFPFLFLQGVFMAREYFVPIQLLGLAKKVGVILITVALLFMNSGVIALVVAFGAVPFLIHVYQAWYLYRKGVRVRPLFFSKSIAREILTLSLWLFLIVLSELFIINISPAVLARYAGSEQIAVFAIGLTFYNYVYAFSGAVNGFFLPRIYKLKNKGDNLGITNMSTLVSAVQMWIVGLFFVGFLVLGRQFLRLWVGAAFDGSFDVAMFLLLPVMVTLCQSVESQRLLADDKMRYRSFMMAGTALLSLGLSVWLCPQMGAKGAAVAICVANVVFNIVGMNIIYHYVSRCDTLRFFLLALRYVVTFAAVYFLSSALCHLLPGSSWLNLIEKGLLYAAVYGLATYFLAMPERMKQQLINPLLRIRPKGKV